MKLGRGLVAALVLAAGSATQASARRGRKRQLLRRQSVQHLFLG